MQTRALILFLFLHFAIFSQENITLISWNIQDLGRTKNDEELEAIAQIIRDADIVAIQEVVAGYGGAQAVARLHDLLNRKGSNLAILQTVLNMPLSVTLFFGRPLRLKLKIEEPFLAPWQK